MTSSRPLTSLPARILFALVLALTVAMVGSADRSRAAEPATEPARTSTVDGAPTGTVTLITGDRVTLGPPRDGEPTVTLEPRTKDAGFSITRDDGRVVVVPDEVAALVPDVLDPGLFEVTRLVEMGYDDSSTEDIPVILRRAPGVRTLAAGPLDVGRELHSIAAHAATLDKSVAPELGETLATLGASRPGPEQTGRALGGVTKIWLDSRVEPSDLDRERRETSTVVRRLGEGPSEPAGYLNQVNAPAAWAAGLDGAGVKVAVLDTGVDAGHPALDGQVDAEANFSDAESADDGQGHGTHVASILAGTGAESDGTLQGIVPAADLISGKVLDDEGAGQLSWVIAGMEWAVDQGADVVNLSLGGPAGPSDDPVVEALDALAAESGALFVVAAGNASLSGGSPQTIETPGAASSALTVGAVDDSDSRAEFSSEGPTLGSYRLKPDIAAPGIEIPGARAGARDGDFYLPGTGTSQATPVVAGAAGLLLQRYPGWSWDQVKAHLVTTAAPAEGQTSWTHGGGRLDLAQVDRPSLRSDLANLDFGLVEHGDDASRTRAVMFTNDTDTPVTVDITDEQVHRDGTAAPESAVTVAPATLTVPAGGSATATVTFDAKQLGHGLWHGSLSVSAEDTLLSLPFGTYVGPETHDLDLQVVDRRGQPVAGGNAQLFNADTGRSRVVALDGTGQATVRVAPGPWHVASRIVTPARGEEAETFTMTVHPEVMVTGRTQHTVDARDAEQVQAATVEGRPTDPVAAVLSFARHDSERHGLGQTLHIDPKDVTDGRVFVTPTAPVEHGTFHAAMRWRLEPSGEVRADEPAVYDLMLTEPVLTSSLSPHLDEGDLATMARLDQSFNAVSTPGEAVLRRGAFVEGAMNEQLVTASVIEVPQRRIALVTADADVHWDQCVTISMAPPGSVCARQETSFHEGERVETDWGTGLHPDVAKRDHDLWGLILEVGIADGEHVGQMHHEMVEESSLRLWRDGVLVGESEGLIGHFPPDAGDFRLEHTWTLNPDVLGVATEAATAWEFSSAPAADPTNDGGNIAPMLSIDYGADVDELGQARPRRALHLEIAVADLLAEEASRVSDLELGYSTDDGDSWTSLRTRRTGDNTFRALVPGGRLHSGDTVSMRASAHDADGNSIEQTVVGMIPIA